MRITSPFSSCLVLSGVSYQPSYDFLVRICSWLFASGAVNRSRFMLQLDCGIRLAGTGIVPWRVRNMSDREKAKHLIDQIPEYKIELVLAYLQGVFDGVSETPNKETIAAFKEIEEGGGHLFSGSTEDLFIELSED